MNTVFLDFKFHKSVNEETITKYKNKVPEELINVWENYGYGSLLNGYLKIINPDEYKELVEETYFRGNISVPIFSTGMGDIICWEENRYLRLIEYRKGIFKGISAGFEFFFSDLTDKRFCEKYLDSAQYNLAVEKYGVPDFEECFGYVPLLVLGGSEEIEKLKKVKLFGHILLITQLTGPIA